MTTVRKCVQLYQVRVAGIIITDDNIQLLGRNETVLRSTEVRVAGIIITDDSCHYS